MSLEDHAIVEREGFRIPLIGIPPEAMLQECDLCHEQKPMQQIEMTESGQMLCQKCK